MQKVLIALMAMGGSAFAPSAHQRATVVQQGVPLANGAMEFDRAAPASACMPTRARVQHATSRRRLPRVALQVRGRQGDERVARGLLQGAGRVPARAQEDRRRDGEPCRAVSVVHGVDSPKHNTGLVCGGCLDFKVMVTQPLEGYGPWEEAGHPPEADFIAKLKAIPGVSQVETQTITNMVL